MGVEVDSDWEQVGGALSCLQTLWRLVLRLRRSFTRPLVAQRTACHSRASGGGAVAVRSRDRNQSAHTQRDRALTWGGTCSLLVGAILL